MDMLCPRFRDFAVDSYVPARARRGRKSPRHRGATRSPCSSRCSSRRVRRSARGAFVRRGDRVPRGARRAAASAGARRVRTHVSSSSTLQRRRRTGQTASDSRRSAHRRRLHRVTWTVLHKDSSTCGWAPAHGPPRRSAASRRSRHRWRTCPLVARGLARRTAPGGLRRPGDADPVPRGRPLSAAGACGGRCALPALRNVGVVRFADLGHMAPVTDPEIVRRSPGSS